MASNFNGQVGQNGIMRQAVAVTRNDFHGEEIHKVASAQSLSRESLIQHSPHIRSPHSALTAEIVDYDNSLSGELRPAMKLPQFRPVNSNNKYSSPSRSNSTTNQLEYENFSNGDNNTTNKRNGLKYSLSTASFKSAFKFSSTKSDKFEKLDINESNGYDPRDRRGSHPASVVTPDTLNHSPEPPIHSPILSEDLMPPTSRAFATLHSPTRSSVYSEKDVLRTIESRTSATSHRVASTVAPSVISTTAPSITSTGPTPTPNDQMTIRSENSDGSLSRSTSSLPSLYPPKVIGQLWTTIRPKILESMRDYRDISNGISAQWVSTVSSHWTQ
jgi:hypothetical protein